jgi:hypothetical protein
MFEAMTAEMKHPLSRDDYATLRNDMKSDVSAKA